MKILVIGTLYTPDLGPSAPLFSQLCEKLVALKHEVLVITMVPHYPSGYVSPPYRGKILDKSIENGVNVIRIGLPSLDRSKLFFRLIQFFCYQIGATLIGCTKKYDVVLAANSSLSVWLPYFWYVVIRNKPTIYSVQDVYPDIGIKLGIFRNKFVISIVTMLEKYCLNHSSIVQVISESFKESLYELGVQESKIKLIPNWVDIEFIKPMARENNFSRKTKLLNTFNIIYAGNIGKSQGLENILTVAKLLENQKDIRFVFIGDGSEKNTLIDQATKENLSNVIFLPFEPRTNLPEVLATSDISLVSLKNSISFDSAPSKIYSIMASGRPIIACVDEGCEAFNLINQSKAGFCISPGDHKGLMDTILLFKSDQKLREKLGMNGRCWVEMYNSPSVAAQEFESIFLSLC